MTVPAADPGRGPLRGGPSTGSSRDARERLRVLSRTRSALCRDGALRYGAGPVDRSLGGEFDSEFPAIAGKVFFISDLWLPGLDSNQRPTD